MTPLISLAYLVASVLFILCLKGLSSPESARRGILLGELGMLAPARTRTQTLVCTQGGSLLEIAYDRIEQLYYQNPKFGFYFLRLATARLFENIGRLEGALAERDQEILTLRKAATAS